MSIRVGIVGVSGYGGGEALRIRPAAQNCGNDEARESGAGVDK